MGNRLLNLLALAGFNLAVMPCSYASRLPNDFVGLRSVSPAIEYNIRYAANHNFVGRPIKGYYAARCMLTKPAARALSEVEDELLRSGLSLMVYDCYRPQIATRTIQS